MSQAQVHTWPNC